MNIEENWREIPISAGVEERNWTHRIFLEGVPKIYVNEEI